MSYTILLVNPSGMQKELTNARDIWFEKKLNAPGQAQFSLPLHATGIDLYDITLCYSQLFIYRDNSLRWAGEIQTRRADNQNNQIVYGAVGWMARTYTRLVGSKDAPRTFTDTDASVIVDTLMTETQGLPNGNLNLVAGTLATASHHDRTSLQYERLLDVLQGLTNDHIEDGIDLEFTPDGKYNTYYPAKGTDRPEIIFATGENILAWSISENGTEMANEVTALGAGEGSSMPTQIASSASYLQTSYGLRQLANPYKSVSDSTNLLSHAQADLAIHQTITPVISITADGKLFPSLDLYDTGDRVSVKIAEGGVQLDAMQRLYIKRVYIGNDGEEQAQLTLNPT